MQNTFLPSPCEYGCRQLRDGSYQATVWVGSNFERRQQHVWASSESYASKPDAMRKARAYLNRLEQVGGSGFGQATLRIRPA